MRGGKGRVDKTEEGRRGERVWKRRESMEKIKEKEENKKGN